VPEDQARDVPISVVPGVVFDVPLDPNTIDPDAFRLWSGELRPGGALVYSMVDRSLTFTPGVTLRARLAYVARLASSVRGIDGSVPAEPVEILFFTGSDDRGRPAAPPEPTFAEDILPLFEAHCASCHGGERPAAGLPLAASADVRSAAVRDSGEWLGWAVVAPGSPERSYLMYKVVGAPGLVGGRMPPDGTLAYDERKNLERWITLGARSEDP
jgi:mono/diheme cytochrome c family protein